MKGGLSSGVVVSDDGNTNTPTLSVAGDERSKIVCGAVSQWLPVSCKLSWVVFTR